jgi:hypothetical protein
MSDFEIDWGMEDGLHVDHDGGVDHVFADHQFDDHHDFSDGTDSASDLADLHTFGEIDDLADVNDEPPHVEDTELPEWQLDADFTDGHYDLVGADPDENDMWSQFMTDMHEEVNPYAAN